AKLAADELRHCATLGLHGAVFVPWGSAMPVWHEMWEPVWSAAEETGLVVSFHVFEGGGATVGYEGKGVRAPAVIRRRASAARLPHRGMNPERRPPVLEALA